MTEDRWSTYEANVQAYRGNFFSSQSILLAVGALLIDKHWLLLLGIAVLALIQIWLIWNRLIVSRLYIVDYHKFHMKEHFDYKGNIVKGDNPNYLREGDYVSNNKLRAEVNNRMCKETEWDRVNVVKIDGKEEEVPVKFVNMRITRRKIDIYLPIFISLTWGVLVLIAAFG